MIGTEWSVVVRSNLPMQFSRWTDELLTAAEWIGGLAVLSAVVAGAVAIVYRWYTRERISNPPVVLLALGTVAVDLNARTALGEFMGETATLSPEIALFNVGALAVGTVAALLGIAGGDHLARTVRGVNRQVDVDDSLGRLARTVGRVTQVELPDGIEDVPGYDPVDAATKTALEGTTLVFPQGLSADERRDRIDRRLREDYRVGHVDVDIAADGSIEFLAVGRRPAGIGPTLPPESAAMAIRADPANAASAGDLVQVWSNDPKQRLLNAEIRGTAGDVVTIAMDAADASKLDPDSRYKLVTLPVEQRADRELTELLRAADETLGVVEIGDRSLLSGTPIGALDVTVVAVHAGGPEDRVETLPSSDRVLQAGESVYVVARPDVIRRIEQAADVTSDGGEDAAGTIPADKLGARPGGPGRAEPAQESDVIDDASGRSTEAEENHQRRDDGDDDPDHDGPIPDTSPENAAVDSEQSQPRAGQSAESSDQSADDDRPVETSEGDHAPVSPNVGAGNSTSAERVTPAKQESTDENPPDPAVATDAPTAVDVDDRPDGEEEPTDSNNPEEDTSEAVESEDGTITEDTTAMEPADGNQAVDPSTDQDGSPSQVNAIEETEEDRPIDDGDGERPVLDEGDTSSLDDIDIESLEDVDVDDIDINPLEPDSDEQDDDRE